jgi:type I restriction enzyme M protein
LREVEHLQRPRQMILVVRSVQDIFAPYTSIPTNLLFFNRGGPTGDVWCYEHPLPEGRKNYSMTQPLQYEEFAPCLAWWKDREENDRAWKVPAVEILANGCNLDLKNPRGREDFEHMPPERLAEDILNKELRIAEIMREIQGVLAGAGQ